MKENNESIESPEKGLSIRLGDHSTKYNIIQNSMEDPIELEKELKENIGKRISIKLYEKEVKGILKSFDFGKDEFIIGNEK